jgi:hypothetical protein
MDHILCCYSSFLDPKVTVIFSSGCNDIQRIMRYQIAHSVRRAVARLFPPDQVDAVLEQLASTQLPLGGDWPERIHLAILHLSHGDMHRFKQQLADARLDWRDTLVADGLANEDWREVLRGRGIELDKRQP